MEDDILLHHVPAPSPHTYISGRRYSRDAAQVTACCIATPPDSTTVKAPGLPASDVPLNSEVRVCREEQEHEEDERSHDEEEALIEALLRRLSSGASLPPPIPPAAGPLVLEAHNC